MEDRVKYATGAEPIKTKYKELVLCIRNDSEEKYNINISRPSSIHGYHTAFLPRHMIEDDPKWRQIIPYAVLTRVIDDIEHILVYKRSNEGDRELADAYSVGVGGHIAIDDAVLEDYPNKSILPTVIKCLMREIFEEFNRPLENPVLYETIQDRIEIIIKGDTGIDSFHLGLVIKLTGGESIYPRSEEISECRYMTLDKAMKIEGMESWSQDVLNFFKESEMLT